MSNPVNHKTIFVLDHGAKFAEPCGQTIDFEAFCKARQPGIIPLAPVSKTLWTCTVEAAMEYCRIVWDVYPRGKLIRFIASSSEDIQVLNSWKQEEQNLNKMMDAFASVGPADCDETDSSSIVSGLSAAVDKLCEPTEVQHGRRTNLADNSVKVINRARVICITNVKNEKHKKAIQDYFQDAISKKNKVASQSDHLIPIDHCELVIIHTVPVTESPVLKSTPKEKISSILSVELVSTQSGIHLANKLCHLVLLHFDLASTTVTGIPMKEEQNANSSANYDVELFHPSDAHVALIKMGYSLMDGSHVRAPKEGTEYETVTLKWCTPRSAAVEMHYCIAMYRITPVDVNSRPSSCLTNFLLNGRSVMLELPRKAGTKILSHMLTSHGGEIFIHTLATSRSILEDPPSISEGSGGRVTDYRITDFGDFMKEHRLAPVRESTIDPDMPPINRAMKQLELDTRYWPMVISNTTIFNMTQHLNPLPTLIKNERLSDFEVTECKKVIYNLLSMESRSEPLPIPNLGTRGKGPKREEQYRVMWNELENFVRVHCSTEGHSKVLECIQECRKPNQEEGKAGSTPRKSGAGPEKVFGKEEKMEVVDVAWKEMERYNKMTEREKSDFNKSESSKSNGPSPFRSPLTAKKMKIDDKPTSLLSIITNRLKVEHSKHHIEFAGRLNSVGGIAKLYPNLGGDPEEML